MEIPAFLTEPIITDKIDPPVEEHLQELPYNQISWENFEKLCYELAIREKEVVDARSYGVQGNAQDGIDIYATSTAGNHTVYQCKREKSFTPTKIDAAVTLFLSKEWAAKAEKFILCTQESLKKKDRADEVIKQEAILKAQGISFVTWDSPALNSKLKVHPQLVYDFFGLNWVIGFCGKDKLRLIDLHEPLPDKKVYSLPALYLPRTVKLTDEDVFAFSFLAPYPTLYEVIQKQQKIALLAWGLSGKSTELQYVAHKLATETEYYPFLELFENYSDEDIDILIPEVERIPQLNIVLLLDGLDEVLPDKFALATRKIARFCVQYPLATVIVSCRTNFYTTFKGEKEHNTLKGFESYQLNTLGGKEVEEYLLRHDAKNKDAFLEEVNRKQLRELLFVPYYLTKLASEFKNTGRISNSKAELFRDEVKHLIHKEVARNYVTDHETLERKLYLLLKKVAFVMEAMGVNNVDTEDLNRIIPLEKDRKLVTNSASIFHGTESNEKIWKFHHHNTQEFLAADTLSNKSFDYIRKIIGIAPDYHKAKPLWVNTILFLNNILPTDSQLKLLIVNWLTTYNKELLIKLDPEKLEQQARDTVFKAIFNQYKADNRRINNNLYRYDDLANFSQGPGTFDFLLKELKTSKSVANLANALAILNYFELSKYPNYLPLFKEQLNTILFSTEEELHHIAIVSYTMQTNITEQEFDLVFEKFKGTEDEDIRSTLFEAIYTIGYVEKYLDFIIAEVILLIEEDRKALQGGRNRTHHSTGGNQMAKCLESVKTEDGLSKIFSGLENYLLAFGHSGSFEQSLEILIAHASAVPSNKKLIDQIVKVFKTNHSYILHDLKASVIFLDFFTQNNLVDPICSDLCNNLQLNDASMINTISLLAGKPSIDLLAVLLSDGKIDERTIDSFNYFLEKNDNVQLAYFREVFAIIPPVEKPKRDFEKVEEERHTRDLLALFNKVKFKEEISLIFSGFGKDNISYDDLNYSDPDYWSEKYCSIARDLLELRPNAGQISLAVFLQSIENNWERHYYTRIYDYLVKNPKAVLSVDQENTVLNWCNLQSELSSFSNGIEQTDAHNWSLNHSLVMFSFFIRKLNILTYNNTLYLDLLSFIKYDDSLIEIFDFVATVPGITDNNIRERVLINLEKGITNVRSMDYHLNYIRKHEIKEAATLLIPYLKNLTTVNRSDILKLFLTLGGNLVDLKDLLLKESDLKYYLIDEFIKTDSSFIKGFLKREFVKEKDETKKLSLAKYLIQFQDVVGLKFYLKYVKFKRRVPDDSSPGNALFTIHKAKFTYQVLEMVKLSQDPSIIHDDFRDLRSISFNCLRNLVVYPGNYKQVKRMIALWTLKQKTLGIFNKGQASAIVLNTLKLYMEVIEQQFNVNNSKVFKLDEAINLFNLANESH